MAEGSRHFLATSAGILVIAAIGTATLLTSHAATPTANYEAEAGNRTGSCISSDPLASGGQAVTFGASGCSGDSTIPGLSRIPWEGGSAYWSQFSKANAGGWTDPNFFPIAVFYGKADPTHVSALKDAGINIYAPVEHSPSIFPLTNITNAGLFAIPGSTEWSTAEVGSNPKAVGWFLSDECEMITPNCPGYEGGEGEQVAWQLQQAEATRVRNFNDGRFQLSNFGNGILRTYWASTTMSQQVQLMDVASADKYTYTSPDVAGIIDGFHDAPDWPNGVPVARAYSYGWQADQMRRFQNQSELHPVWTFVETAKPYLTESGSTSIQPAQISGAVWSALIHEARGIYYFQHNNSSTGCTANYSIVECPAIQAAVKAVNAQVKSLAPVLNTQSYYNSTRTVNGYTYYQYSFGNGTDTMLKSYNGSAYIFAGLGMRCANTSCTSGAVDSTGSKTFTLPTGVNGTTVEVVGEGRTLQVTNRTFSDSFATEYSTHVYKVSL